MITYSVDVEQEADGRWIAEIADLPGVMVYGATADEALAKVQALALRVVADGLEHGGRLQPSTMRVPHDSRGSYAVTHVVAERL